MATSTTTARELTREQVQTILIKPLQDQSVFLAAGPRIFDTDGSLVRIPKLGGPTAPSWHGENEQISEVNASFEEITLLPNTMKSIKTITRFSNEMARQSIVNLDQVLKQRLVGDVADTLDKQLLSASGDGTTLPKGLFAHAGIQKLTSVGALSLDTLHDAWATALTANVNMASLKWLLNPREFSKLRKIKDTQGRYQLQPDPTQDGVFRLLGAPVIVTSRIPDTTGATPTGRAALVDFSQIAVARDQAPTVSHLTERYSDQDQQALKVTCRYDAKPMNPQAIIALEGITI